jgi:hypothetical protein
VAVRGDRLIRQVIRRRFLVTTDTEEGFEGVLLEADEGHYVFDDVTSVAVNGDRLHLDSKLWIPRPRVKYMQDMSV